MAKRFRPKKRRASRSYRLHKPHGTIGPRVQAVGGEHFAIVSVDCAKARSKWMMADFFGNVLVPPKIVEHTSASLQTMIRDVRETAARSNIRDMIVAIERTGRYHAIVQRACVRAKLETRLVHPFATKQFRQPADPDNKTDDTDLAAIFRAAANGFGLIEQPPDPILAKIQLLARHRRNLVDKTTALRCQIHEHLHAMMPGYAKCFDDIYSCRIPLAIARAFGSAPAILAAGLPGLTEEVRKAGIRPHHPTLVKILGWAGMAAPGSEETFFHHRFMIELDDDRNNKRAIIAKTEADLLELLVQTPYVLLLQIPGINVVSAAEFAGEMGPITAYPKPSSIAGRAGLYPSRYQSDEVDCPDGRLVRCANRSLRQIIMLIADNLIECNDHFRVLAAKWKLEGKDARCIRVRVAGRFCRIAYYIVAGQMTYQHPSCHRRDYILRKLITFSSEHAIGIKDLMRDLTAAISYLPRKARVEEGTALAAELAELRKKRGSGPRPLAEILPAVLVKLGVGLIESTPSGEATSS